MVYIQSDNERRLPHNFDAACALYGAMECGQNFRLTTYEEVVSGKFDALLKQHLFVGSVDFMCAVFERAGVEIPSIIHLNRNYTRTTLADARVRIAQGEKWFIKPLHTKLFTGMVFDGITIGQLAQYPGETEVLLAKPFAGKILSETRCYVSHGRMVDVRNYAGDFRAIPDWVWAESVLDTLQSAPIAFTMDLAVLDDGGTVVVEFNDMWAIGNYGMENGQYYALLAERYFEIVG